MVFLLFAPVLGACAKANADDSKPVLYPARAPIEQYRMADRAAEIALARTAAPPSVSGDAEVLVLGEKGYESVVPGKNGFVCFVERSWESPFADPEFWNPKERSPNCFNPPAVRTELHQVLKRAEWVIAGLSKEQIQERTRAAYADKTFEPPAPEAMSFMLSKQGYLSDAAGGPWHPHVMLFVPHGEAATWGAGLEGSPVLGQDGSDLESTVLFIPVGKWSDGTPATPSAGAHTHT
jgi:hypothetical protein